MKKYRNGKLVEMTHEEVKAREEDVARLSLKIAQRELELAHQQRRQQALVELIDTHIASKL